MISVVLPAYLRKREHISTIKECVESIRQNSSGYELILVDDASPLDTSFIDCDKRVTHKVNKGVAPSWNSGIKASKGKLIVIINDDIVVPPSWLPELSKVFNLPNVGVVGPAVERLPNGIGIEESYVWFPGSCFMLSRETIEKVGLFDEDFAPFYFEDSDYWTRVLAAKLKLYRNHDVFVGHKEGQTVKDLARDEQYKTNLEKFIKKHGFDPIPVFCK